MLFTRPLGTLALTGLVLACGPIDDAPSPSASATAPGSATETALLELSVDFVDGAGEARRVELVDATLLEDGLRLRYRALVDGQPRTMEYAQYGSDAPMEVTVTGPDARSEVGLFIEHGQAEFFIAGQPVGLFAWDELGTTITTPLSSDPLSFALLSLFPHQVTGAEPARLFEQGRQVDAAAGFGALEQGISLGGILRGIGKIFGGGARVTCTKVKIYSCQEQCTQTADGCACGAQCGTIACCSSGCKTEERTEYKGGVGGN